MPFAQPKFISDCDIEKLKPYERNPRKNDPAIEAVVSSIESFGFINPIVVDEDFRICAGHTRFKAATQIGLKTVPVIVAPQLVGDKFAGYNIADNQTASIAEWDERELAGIIKELQENDFEIDALGFNAEEFNAIMSTLDEPPEYLKDPDWSPEPEPDNPVTKTGDLWLLGDHRLLCGDATKKEDVDGLMGGNIPTLMVTDPPYGVNYNPAWRDEAAAAGHLTPARRRIGKVTSDDVSDWSGAWGLFSGDVVYCWHAGQHASVVEASLLNTGFPIRCQIVWAKPGFVISRGHYNGQHEPCWYAVRKGSTAHWIGDHSQSTLWEISNRLSEAEGKTNHGTQKPIECMARPARNHSGDVYDPFLGSGTTMIACEQLGRKCYGMEIDPVYCDVAVRRWEGITGKKAELAT